MKLILTLFGVFLAVITWSQNYQTINSKDINYFENFEANYYLATRIDSTHLVDEDSIFYSFQTFRRNTDTCEVLISPCWLGEKVIVETNGTNLFFNNNGDTITILTQAELNDTFTVYTYPTGEFIKGWISSIIEEEILGVLDSVKTISLFSNSDEFNLIDPEFKIGKLTGFTTIYPFYTFPEAYQPIYTDEKMYQPLKLVGSEYPRVGITKNTVGEIHDHEIGDRIIYSSYEETSTMFSSFGSSRIRELLFIDKNYISEDTLAYTMEVKYKYSTFNSWDDGTGPIYGTRTETKVVSNLDKKASPYLPEEFHWVDYDIAQNHLTYLHCGRLAEVTNYLSGYGCHDDEDTTCKCLQQVDMGVSYYNKFNVIGLGGQYFGYSSFYVGDGMQDVSEGIRYYSDADGECGSNFSLSTDKNEIENDLIIYPNPTTNYLTINHPQFTGGFLIEIYNSTGNLIKSEIFSEAEKETQIDVRALQNGVYSVQITTDNITMQKQFIKL
ncbi:T9SS type A sorting domain-containing protein [Crocinitomix catalasitica]|uniref:T9SS type A sorting domain-containing protein n=1 Tax=Crocinitomix catalasitica TaxID=184607 RepID=UPI000483245F|nr:T9SS type A sorting domain-containing protein [Crocinitomix catalasitica]